MASLRIEMPPNQCRLHSHHIMCMNLCDSSLLLCRNIYIFFLFVSAHPFHLLSLENIVFLYKPKFQCAECREHKCGSLTRVSSDCMCFGFFVVAEDRDHSGCLDKRLSTWPMQVNDDDTTR